MKIRKALFAELKKWYIEIKNDENQLVSFVAIPPSKDDRIDVLLEIREYIDKSPYLQHIQVKYIYDFKGDIKKLKGEKIIITIKNGNAEIELKN